MSNCIECGNPNPPSRGNRKRKYCSKKCANDYHHKKNSTRRPGWGNKFRQSQIEKDQRRKEYEEVLGAGWVEYGALAKQMNITRSGLYHRIKNLLQEGVETKKVHDGTPGGNGWRRYVHPDAIQKLKNPYPIPEGSLTSSESAAYVGYSHQYFKVLCRKYDVAPLAVIRLPSGNKGDSYSIEQLNNLKEQIKKDLEKQKIEKEALKKKKKSEIEDQYQESIRGLISFNEVLTLFGYKSKSPIKKMIDRGLLTPRIIRGARWFDPQQVRRCFDLWEEKNRLRKESIGKLPHWRFRRDNLRPWERREERAKNYIPHDANPKSVESNRMYWAHHEEGIIHKRTCSKCSETKPYYMFYLSWKKNTSGRSAQCVQCKKQSRPTKKTKRKDQTPEQKLKRIFGISIKRHLSRIKKTYVSDLTQGYIWQKLEENCGYNEKKLVEHIESQFTPEMNWDNYGQLGTTIPLDQFCWNIDHIKPKNSFYYESLNDEEFIKCWSLDNLRPLDARENSRKGKNN